MSIFKETFKDFVFKQLRIREAIIKKGNNPTEHQNRFGSPRTEIIGKGNKKDKIKLAAGAFYTNTVNKQCVIRMSSGVDVTSTKVLEQYEERMLGENLAKSYVLEGGVLDFGQNRGGFTKGPQSRFGAGDAYGDINIRSDAGEGFGIVPMPGIIDADIRTKTAYGSLREAKVNFVCHNKRQLEVLELLYMRPGFPILLEWQWSPFINNKGKIDNNLYGIGDDWFDNTKSTNDLNLRIIEEKEKSKGNYDGFVGFCKNFEFTSRPDGGYDCTTEIIAAGEVLEGLKSRSDGYSTYEEETNKPVDNMQLILGGLKDLESISLMRGFVIPEGSLAVPLMKTVMGIEHRHLNHQPNRVIDPIYLQHLNEMSEEDLENLNSEERSERWNKRREVAEYFLMGSNPHDGTAFPFIKKTSFKDLYIWRGQALGIKTTKQWLGNKSRSGLFRKHSYVRWDHLCDLINELVFPFTNPDKPEDPLIQLTYTKPKDDGGWNTYMIKAGVLDEYDTFFKAYNLNNSDEEYINYVPFKFPEEGKINIRSLHLINNTDGRIKKIKEKIDYGNLETSTIFAEEVLNNSFDPTICLLPSQYDSPESDENVIGHIMLNIDYLKSTYNQMAYSDEEPKEDFNLFDYFKKIWDGVNKSCIGNHNFILNNELERPNRIRILDFQVDPPKNIEPNDLFEFKIQNNQSIVRDFNYNTTIPSSLSATIAIAAQAPTSVSSLDQITFANFSKGIKSRFQSSVEPTTTKDLEGKNESIKKAYRNDLKRYRINVVELALYQAKLIRGDFTDKGTKIDGKSFGEAVSIGSSIQRQITSLLQKNPIDGKRNPLIPSSRSAIIPLKFNASMDGISGIVIGNVFKIEKDKLPKGYQDDDVAFVVMGESQKITSGQDWTTELSGQLILLDLGMERREEQIIEYQEFDFTIVKDPELEVDFGPTGFNKNLTPPLITGDLPLPPFNIDLNNTD